MISNVGTMVPIGLRVEGFLVKVSWRRPLDEGFMWGCPDEGLVQRSSDEGSGEDGPTGRRSPDEGPRRGLIRVCRMSVGG